MNESFSQSRPNLQIAWDSTSLGALKECPRKYQYSIIMGYAPSLENVHLKFGQLYHGALERYDHSRSNGASHQEATVECLRWALISSWNTDTNSPWLSDNPNKNRFTLIRTIVWYLDQFETDPIETIQLASGKPAVELSFRFELDFAPEGSESPYLLCGHLDRLGQFNDSIYICDRKTTKNTLGENYFSQYSPDNQFSLYTFAGSIVYGLPIEGLIVDAAQVAVTFSRFQRGFIQRTPDQIAEWYADMQFYIRQAELFAKLNYWPQNDKSCFGCQFRPICAKPPSSRHLWLDQSYAKRVWNPLAVRGDI